MALQERRPGDPREGRAGDSACGRRIRAVRGTLLSLVAAMTATLVVVVVTLQTRPLELVGPEGHWSLAFREEFNGDRLNTQVWKPNRFGGDTTDGAFNPAGEDAAFAPKNVRVMDGELKLVLTAVPALIDSRQYPFTSGAVMSQGAAVVKEGDYVEARGRVPRGAGLWPAFWAVTDNSWPPEIDGFEYFDSATQARPAFNYHATDGKQSGPSTFGRDGDDYREGWHDYGWLRQGSVLTPYLDGIPYPAASASGVDARDYFIVLNLSVVRGARPELGPGKSELRVNWVRIWKPLP
jgi:beta-glucanase (GH16 family)